MVYVLQCTYWIRIAGAHYDEPENVVKFVTTEKKNLLNIKSLKETFEDGETEKKYEVEPFRLELQTWSNEGEKVEFEVYKELETMKKAIK